ncbi:hypothetical protein Sjap_025607 [Stephania japonica]|uniref:Secreted protein n=1 Tax=Stephania japonica TaxID=461633 RepID=A0AAP0E233_9MAGN
MSLLALTSISLFFSMAFTTINARTVLPVPVVDADGDPVQTAIAERILCFRARLCLLLDLVCCDENDDFGWWGSSSLDDVIVAVR